MHLHVIGPAGLPEGLGKQGQGLLPKSRAWSPTEDALVGGMSNGRIKTRGHCLPCCCRRIQIQPTRNTTVQIWPRRRTEFDTPALINDKVLYKTLY